MSLPSHRASGGTVSRAGPVSHGKQRTAAPPPEPGRPVASGRRVRLLCSDPELIEAVEAVCVSCRAHLRVTDELEPPGRPADLVLIDAAHRVEPVPAGAVLVALSSRAEVWSLAARSSARAVVVLPDAAEWLAEMISDEHADNESAQAGRVIGVVGAVGGAGASTLACWLADALARKGGASAVVDAQPRAAGLDLVLGTETEDGLRWPELHQFSGAVAADQLWAALPAAGALRYLSWDRNATHAGTVPMGTVIHALRGAARFLVVDLNADRLSEQSRWCDALLVLTPRTVRGVLAAAHAAGRSACEHTVTVLSGLNIADVDAAAVETATGVPCAGSIGFDPRVPQDVDIGASLQRGRRPRHARAVRAVLEALGTS